VLMAAGALGAVFLISHGYLTTVWNYLYNAAHMGYVDPFSQSQNPFNPVTVGGGPDISGPVLGAVGTAQEFASLPGKGNVYINGNIRGNTFTPTDTRVPSFQVPSGGVPFIPTTILQTLVTLGLY
jgi:hypothetical protein